MMRLKRTILLIMLALICLTVTSCRLTREIVYVPPGKAVEVREEVMIPVWVRDGEEIKQAWVKAGPYWRLGPPPWITKDE